MRVFILLLIGGSIQSVYSQQPSDSTKFKMHYFGNLLSGVQIGCNCTTGNQMTASAYLINGIRLTKGFAVGIGVGADSYQQWKTMPLFVHLSQKIAGSKNVLLLQVNTGYAWAWYDRQEYTLPNFQQVGGFMFHPALTYQIAIEKWNLNFSVGYKNQITKSSTRYQYQSYGGIAYSETTVKNEFNRLVIQIGFGWR